MQIPPPPILWDGLSFNAETKEIIGYAQEFDVENIVSKRSQIFGQVYNTYIIDKNQTDKTLYGVISVSKSTLYIGVSTKRIQKNFKCSVKTDYLYGPDGEYKSDSLVILTPQHPYAILSDINIDDKGNISIDEPFSIDEKWKLKINKFSSDQNKITCINGSCDTSAAVVQKIKPPKD